MPKSEINSSFSATPQVDASIHYNPLHYLSPERLASIGYQLQFLGKYFPVKSLLEIGVGSGLTAQLLRAAGFQVTTLDIDDSLKPDVLGSVTQIPLPDQFVDAFCCCQVLEHLPWNLLGPCLNELNRISKFGGLISVPTRRRRWMAQTYSATHTRRKTISLPQRFPKPMLTRDGQHYWELEANIRTSHFVSELKLRGFRLTHNLQLPENPYHHFFVVKKS